MCLLFSMKSHITNLQDCNNKNEKKKKKAGQKTLVGIFLVQTPLGA